MTRPTYGEKRKIEPKPKGFVWRCMCGACYYDSTTADRHYKFYHEGVHDDDLKKK